MRCLVLMADYSSVSILFGVNMDFSDKDRILMENLYFLNVKEQKPIN